jgi:PAS domain S-box-containing protein
MSKSNRPTPKDIEITLSPKKTIVSRTDEKGIIRFVNDYFMEIAGYKENELVGFPHNVIRHPDMPKIIFKLLWDELKQGNDMRAIVKNLAKDGRYYWVITNFYTLYDDNKNIIGYYARRKAVPQFVKEEVVKLYETLIVIEENEGMKASEKYVSDWLTLNNTTYQDYVESLFGGDKKLIEDYLKSEVSDTDLSGCKDRFISQYEKSHFKEPKKKGFWSKLFEK